MNIRQLQLDDLILYSGKVCRVTAVRLDNDGKVRAVVENDDFCGFVDEIEPIPLTEAILEKNGFVLIDEKEKMYRLNLAEDESVCVTADFKCEEPFVHVRNTCYQATPYCRYVHQLQHALRLCGIEMKIEL